MQCNIFIMLSLVLVISRSIILNVCLVDMFLKRPMPGFLKLLLYGKLVLVVGGVDKYHAMVF